MRVGGLVEKRCQSEVAIAQQRGQEGQCEGMTAAAFNDSMQVFVRGFNTQLAQKFDALAKLKATHKIFLHVGGRILARAKGPEPCGHEDTAVARLAIHGIKPFTDARPVSPGVARLQIKEVLELVE